MTYDVDDATVRRGYLSSVWNQLRAPLAKHRVWAKSHSISDKALSFEVRSEADFDEALRIARQRIYPVPGGRGDDLNVTQEAPRIILSVNQSAVDDVVAATMTYAREAYTREIVERLGSEHLVVRLHGKRLKFQIPGVGSLDELRKLIGMSRAKFYISPLAPPTMTIDPRKQKPPAGYKTLKGWDNSALEFVVARRVFISGSDLVNATAVKTQNGASAIKLQVTAYVAHRLGTLTAANSSRGLAFVMDERVLATAVVPPGIASGIFRIYPDLASDQMNELAANLRMSISPSGNLRLTQEKVCSWPSPE